MDSTIKSEELPKTFGFREAEERWYAHWKQKGYFHSEPDHREPYVVVIPPPNVTGVLHMGHMLNNTIQDVLVRRARMLGKNACWVPGTDHASIATEAKVVQKLRSEGIKKGDLSREEFLQHAWDWTNKHGGIILDQLKKLGASCDWDRTRFTLDSNYYDDVIRVFIDLYEKGYIYRGWRMINWDPQALTALSDEEVIHKEVNSRFYYVRYKVLDTDDEWVTIATTRPETMLGDTAVSVNPNDERYFHLHGKRLIVPIVNRSVPVIADDYVDMELGTGCLKVTPAHDVNDHEIGKRHNLEIIDIMNPDGTIAEKAGFYVGMDRFEARKKIAEDLEEMGYLVKVDDRVNKMGYSERTDVPIEPRLSLQWFCRMEELGKPALDAVMNDTVQFHPAKFRNTYRHWMENIKDWCISRQLWWGHRIPAWYVADGNGGKREDLFYVAATREEAVAMAKAEKARLEQEMEREYDYDPENLVQDDDVLDTWFSSWIWPIAVFNGMREENDEIRYYYPTNDLVTAPEIMFFWVARMIISGYEYRKEPPFRNVYYTGIVRDKLGRKMSKSLGNSPDPLELMKRYSADGVRVGMLLSSPAGNDLLFDSSLCEQGRNFSNKIWNALRLVKGWSIQEGLEQPEASKLAVAWLNARLASALTELDDLYARFRLSEVLMVSYKLFWDDFCAWFLEIVKPGYEQPIDALTLKQTKELFTKLMQVLHPFMPFITEEAWHVLGNNDQDIIVSAWPKAKEADPKLEEAFQAAMEKIVEIRRIRAEKGIAQKIPLELIVRAARPEGLLLEMDAVIEKLGNLAQISYATQKAENAFLFVIGSTEYYIPFSKDVDVVEERKKIQEELEYTQGFLKTVRAKLSNEKFVQGAPEAVVNAERKKESDALSRISVLEQKLTSMN
jgi:valyl-tRNA synthetase